MAAQDSSKVDESSLAMPARSNKHIRKFNQLVDVYDPDSVDQMDVISTRDEERLLERKDELQEIQTQVRALTAEDFFPPAERADIEANESLPAPDDIAQSHREDMLDRLEETESALDEALDATGGLDASDDLILD